MWYVNTSETTFSVLTVQLASFACYFCPFSDEENTSIVAFFVFFGLTEAKGCCFPSRHVFDSSLSVHLTSKCQGLPENPIFQVIDGSQSAMEEAEGAGQRGNENRQTSTAHFYRT